MSVIATVYVDDREGALERNGKNSNKSKKSPIQYLENVFDADNRANGKKTPTSGGGIINYKVTRLTVSDYLLTIRNSSGKNIVVAAIERKRWKDLASTITGTRSETQPRDLRLAKSKYGCYIYYIAEGSFSYTDDYKIGGGGHGQPFKALHSKLRHETIRGIPFIQTKDPEHTVQMLTRMTRDFIKLQSRGEVAFPLQETPATENPMLAAYAYHIRQLGEQFTDLAIRTSGKNSVALLAAIDDINENIDYITMSGMSSPSESPEPSEPPELPESPESPEPPEPPETTIFKDFLEDVSLPELFTKQREVGVSDIIAAMWEAIPGITRNSAPLISQKYTFADLFGCETMDECNAIQDVLSEMKFPSGTRIGKQSEKIMANFRTPVARDEAGVKVLCAIPRITEPIAKAIVAEYNIYNICEKNFKPQLLQSIGNGKRKLGPALAKKIVEVFHT